MPIQDGPIFDDSAASTSGPANEDVRAGDALCAQGQFQAALSHHVAALRLRPDVAEIHYRVAMGLWQIERSDLARDHLLEALRLRPDYAAAHGALGRLLLIVGQIEPAARHARRAVELAPDSAEFAVALASVLEADRDSPAAWEILDRLMAAGHEFTRLALLFAIMAPQQNREIEALVMVDRCLATAPMALPRWRASLHFAAANLLDRMGRYDEAFAHAAAGNAARGVGYEPGQAQRPVQTFIEYFTRPTLRRLPRATHGNETPVFIVGVPRSGTTLVEQILASHPAVYGAGELDWVFGLWETAVQKHGSPFTPITHCLDRMTARDLDKLAEQYLAPLAALGFAAARITDKMPTNFLHLGLISLLFPQARIIHVRRDPLDTCLSCYMTDFAAGHDFTTSLSSLGHFHGQYDRLMAHWKNVLDVPIIEVAYEELVTDVEGQSRRMIEFLDLPWDDRCLRFYENTRFIATASNAQVRRPIYQKSISRWRNYEKHLGPLRAALG